MQKFLFIIIILTLPIIFTGCNAHKDSSPSNYQPITVGGSKLQVEVADAFNTRKQGLSNRAQLKWEHGMLFVFNNYAKYAFWMKDMRFPIDIIWIKDDTIVDIHHRVAIPQNNQNLKRYHPSQAVNYVLEVNAGWVKQNKIKIGDKIKIKK